MLVLSWSRGCEIDWVDQRRYKRASLVTILIWLSSVVWLLVQDELRLERRDELRLEKEI